MFGDSAPFLNGPLAETITYSAGGDDGTAVQIKAVVFNKQRLEGRLQHAETNPGQYQCVFWIAKSDIPEVTERVDTVILKNITGKEFTYKVRAILKNDIAMWKLGV